MTTEIIAQLFNDYAEAELGDANHSEYVKAAYTKLLGFSEDFGGNGARIGYWVNQLASGRLSRDDFITEFLDKLDQQGDLSDDDFQLNQTLETTLSSLEAVETLDEVELTTEAVVAEHTLEEDGSDDSTESETETENDSEESEGEEDLDEENLDEASIEALAALFDDYVTTELSGANHAQLVKAAYEYFLGLTDDFDSSGERLGFWVSQLANGRLDQDDFAEEFLERAFSGSAGLTEALLEENQALLKSLSEDLPASLEEMKEKSSSSRKALPEKASAAASEKGNAENMQDDKAKNKVDKADKVKSEDKGNDDAGETNDHSEATDILQLIGVTLEAQHQDLML